VGTIRAGFMWLSMADSCANDMGWVHVAQYGRLLCKRYGLGSCGSVWQTLVQTIWAGGSCGSVWRTLVATIRAGFMWLSMADSCGNDMGWVHVAQYGRYLCKR
jgi:hypothetical protein